LQFGYGTENITKKFLADGGKNINKISCFDDGTDEFGMVQVSSGQ
jgi:hypothetical protein